MSVRWGINPKRLGTAGLVSSMLDFGARSYRLWLVGSISTESATRHFDRPCEALGKGLVIPGRGEALPEIGRQECFGRGGINMKIKIKSTKEKFVVTEEQD